MRTEQRNQLEEVRVLVSIEELVVAIVLVNEQPKVTFDIVAPLCFRGSLLTTHYSLLTTQYYHPHRFNSDLHYA